MVGHVASTIRKQRVGRKLGQAKRSPGSPPKARFFGQASPKAGPLLPETKRVNTHEPKGDVLYADHFQM